MSTPSRAPAAPAGKRAAPAVSAAPVTRIPKAAATLALFSRQMAQLLQAGLPLLRALETLARQEPEGPFRRLLVGLAETVKSGGLLSDGLARYPKVFDTLFVSMVKAGEASGRLDLVLDRLATFLEKNQKIRKRVRSAMTYPIIVVTVAVAIVGLLMVFVVPRFQLIFTDVLKGRPMPALTQFVIDVSRFVQDQFVLVAVLLAALAFGLPAAFRTPAGARIRDRVVLKVPSLGKLVLGVAVARFARTFGSLLTSGVPILQALNITRDVVGNQVIGEALATVHDRVRDGEPVAAPLERAKVFPGMVTSMIAVGEESGNLAGMLDRVADNYEEEVDNAVAGLLSIIEPIMVVFLAVVVGVIVVALFLPIVSIIQNLQT